ncbi:Rha family transcriptional regulator [Vibrio mediterranei]
MPAQTLPIAQHRPEDLVFVSQTKELVTDSFLVAQYFSKRHDDVLKKIRSLHCSQDFTVRNFAVCHKNNELQNNKLQPFYQMTKDGFMFLVMGFTGKKAAVIKEAYINAFNMMAEKLTNQPQPTPLEFYKDLVDLKDHVNFRMLINIKKGQPQKVRFVDEEAFVCTKERFIELLGDRLAFSDDDIKQVYSVINHRMPNKAIENKKKSTPKLPAPTQPRTIQELIKSKPSHDLRIIRVREVMEITGLARSSIYRIAAEEDNNFPRQVKLGAGSVGWVKQEIDAWVASILEERDN